MGKRFGDLEKQALAILAGGGDPATSLDEGLKKFWAWKINPSAASHNLPAVSERPNGRETLEIHLKPFAATLPANVFATVTLSKRSDTAGGNAIKTACGLTVPTVGTDIGLKLKNFTPARVYWRVGRAASSSDRISRITGRSYKSYYAAADEGFSMPFGKKGTDDLESRQVEIETAVEELAGVGANGLITFSPEKYRK
ncbi:hypothetical protein [Synechocystis sp. PCC 7509]|uniref:hypothetical protein n=1 Tax=Synechocystis sp. PCC 7509 TaxID=927677 RepID=UPI0002AC77C6|nr:hypothetical protein [Synechocystis sp. PCC 7509]